MSLHPATLFYALAALGIAVGLCPSTARGDGCFLPPADYRGAHLREPAQRAVILHAERHQTLLLFVDYAGGADQFAWIIPCPSRPRVTTGDPRVFAELVQFYYRSELAAWRKRGADRAPAGAGGAKPPAPVTVHATRRVGPYQIAIVTSTDSGGLKGWLVDHGYRVPAGTGDVFQQYIAEKWYFVAVKVSVPGRRATLRPLRLDFATPRPVYPLRVSSAGRGLAKLIVYLVQHAADPVSVGSGPLPSDRLDFSRLAQECPRLARLRPDFDWGRTRVQQISATLPPQVMRWHDDRSILPRDYAMAAGIAEAWMSPRAAESAWAEENLYFFLRFRPRGNDFNTGNNTTADERTKLSQMGASLGAPFLERVRRTVLQRIRQGGANPVCEAAISMLPLFGDHSAEALRVLTQAAGKAAHGDAAISAMLALDTPPAREALVRVARSNSPHRIGAWFRYIHGLKRNRIAPPERLQACYHLIGMLSGKNPPGGDARRSAKKLLERYTGQRFGNDWSAWREWLKEHPERFRPASNRPRQTSAARSP